MEKKNLKWYDAPQVEVVEMELQSAVLLSGSEITGRGEEDNEH